MKILIADDDKTQRLLLQQLLLKWDYEPITACDGTEAWNIFQADDPPRIALIDWMMPEYTGVELCKRLRDSEEKLIYKILVTSKQEKPDIIQGLDAGAHDFLVKPVDSSELKSRLSVGARIIEYDDQLEAQNQVLERYVTHMQGLAENQAKQLVHSDRMTTLGVMSAGIAHEINNPTASISGNIQTVHDFWAHIKKLIECELDSNPQNQKQLRFILEELPNALDGMSNGVSRISKIVKGLKAYSRQDTGKRRSCRINNSVNEALGICRHTSVKHVKVDIDLEDNMPDIIANSQEIEQVLINLCVNAADAMENKQDALLQIKTSLADDYIRIVIQDNGPGIPDDIIDKIFDPFFTTKDVGKGTGLGLSISQGIIIDHGGTIALKNMPQSGAQFTIELPCATSEILT